MSRSSPRALRALGLLVAAAALQACSDSPRSAVAPDAPQFTHAPGFANVQVTVMKGRKDPVVGAAVFLYMPDVCGSFYPVRSPDRPQSATRKAGCSDIQMVGATSSAGIVAFTDVGTGLACAYVVPSGDASGANVYNPNFSGGAVHGFRATLAPRTELTSAAVWEENCLNSPVLSFSGKPDPNKVSIDVGLNPGLLNVSLKTPDNAPFCSAVTVLSLDDVPGLPAPSADHWHLGVPLQQSTVAGCTSISLVRPQGGTWNLESITDFAFQPGGSSSSLGIASLHAEFPLTFSASGTGGTVTGIMDPTWCALETFQELDEGAAPGEFLAPVRSGYLVEEHGATLEPNPAQFAFKFNLELNGPGADFNVDVRTPTGAMTDQITLKARCTGTDAGSCNVYELVQPTSVAITGALEFAQTTTANVVRVTGFVLTGGSTEMWWRANGNNFADVLNDPSRSGGAWLASAVRTCDHTGNDPDWQTGFDAAE